MITISTAVAAVILKKWADVDADWAPSRLVLAVFADVIVGFAVVLVLSA